MKRRFVVLVCCVLACALLYLFESNSLLKVGDTAPDVLVTTASGERVALSSYRGRKNVVLYFYPADFTRSCTEEACTFRDRYSEIEKYDAVIIGVSNDGEESHRRFAKAHRLPFALVSDPDRLMSKLYGAIWLRGLLPWTKRVTYVIDKQGIIRVAAHYEVMIGNHLEEVIEGLRHCNIPT